jgi:hypothetical protein
MASRFIWNGLLECNTAGVDFSRPAFKWRPSAVRISTVSKNTIGGRGGLSSVCPSAPLHWPKLRHFREWKGDGFAGLRFVPRLRCLIDGAHHGFRRGLMNHMATSRNTM